MVCTKIRHETRDQALEHVKALGWKNHVAGQSERSAGLSAYPCGRRTRRGAAALRRIGRRCRRQSAEMVAAAARAAFATPYAAPARTPGLAASESSEPPTLRRSPWTGI